ncbi:MAG TPA: hypothetical protein H9665_03780 [Firmicutes bacterium]|nr:hypothetical protein [Bacillota bacterium]
MKKSQERAFSIVKTRSCPYARKSRAGREGRTAALKRPYCIAYNGGFAVVICNDRLRAYDFLIKRFETVLSPAANAFKQ